MSVLKTTLTTYEFDLDSMKALIAKDLDVHPQLVEVTYVIQEVGADPMDRFPGTKQVTKIRVTLTNKVTTWAFAL